VVIEGMDLALPGISWSELRQSVGLVFQYPEQQLFEATSSTTSLLSCASAKSFPPQRSSAGSSRPVSPWAWTTGNFGAGLPSN
jgi:hypothetical protein